MMSDRTLAQVLAGGVLVLIATLLLLYEAQSGVSLMADQERSSSVSTWSTFDRQQQCVRSEIAHKVPEGATVFISGNQSGFNAGQLTELSTPWANPVENRDRADYSLNLVSGSQCEGESVVVVSLR